MSAAEVTTVPRQPPVTDWCTHCEREAPIAPGMPRMPGVLVCAHVGARTRQTRPCSEGVRYSADEQRANLDAYLDGLEGPSRKQCTGSYDDGICDGNTTSCSASAGCGWVGCPSTRDVAIRRERGEW